MSTSIRFFSRCVAVSVGVFVADPVRAEDKPSPAPRVTALAPLAVPQGFTGTVRLRGFRMKEATAVRADGPAQPGKIEIREKKDAATPTGMEKGPLGESEVMIDLAFAADFPPGPLLLVVVAGGHSAGPGKEVSASLRAVGRSGPEASLTTPHLSAGPQNGSLKHEVSLPVTLQVLPPTQLTPEKEPNNGFRTATKIEPGRTVTGLINSPRDVDVFEVAAGAGKRLRVSIIASSVASLLDPLLTAYDAQGRPLAVQDDAAPRLRDPTIEVTPTTDGPVFFVVQDALDFGSEWHAYRLEVATGP